MKRFLLCPLLLILLGIPHYLSAQHKLADSADKTAIQSARAQSNQAIIARDLTGFGRTMLPDIEVTRGSGSHVTGRDSVLTSVAGQFNDPNFLGYVRQTDSIQVNTMGPLAAEHGHWTGRFRRPDGIQIITGTYLSMWRKTDAGWKIQSELFVSLACSGSAACGE